MDIREIGAIDLSSKRLEYLAVKQKITAKNIANSDTPNYRALEMRPFNEVLKGTALTQPVKTHPMHMNGVGHTKSANVVYNKTSQMSPNGNNVTLEEQTLAAAETQMDHAFATSIYKKAASLIITSMK